MYRVEETKNESAGAGLWFKAPLTAEAHLFSRSWPIVPPAGHVLCRLAHLSRFCKNKAIRRRAQGIPSRAPSITFHLYKWRRYWRIDDNAEAILQLGHRIENGPLPSDPARPLRPEPRRATRHNTPAHHPHGRRERYLTIARLGRVSRV